MSHKVPGLDRLIPHRTFAWQFADEDGFRIASRARPFQMTPDDVRFTDQKESCFGFPCLYSFLLGPAKQVPNIRFALATTSRQPGAVFVFLLLFMTLIPFLFSSSSLLFSLHLSPLVVSIWMVLAYIRIPSTLFI
ncbi:hypothetical protein V8F06_005810 [Rhypophila decipiens]